MSDSATADPAMLAWVDAIEDELTRVGTASALFAVIDRTRGQMDWMRVNEPDAAARVDAAIRGTHAQL